MSNRYDDFVTIVAPSANITTGAASASITIPTTSSGEYPRYIRVSSINAAYVKLGTTSATAVAGDILVQPADALILHVPSGYTKIAAIQDAAAGKVNVAPLENM